MKPPQGWGSQKKNPFHWGGIHKSKFFLELNTVKYFIIKILNTDVASQTKQQLLLEKNIQVTNQK